MRRIDKREQLGRHSRRQRARIRCHEHPAVEHRAGDGTVNRCTSADRGDDDHAGSGGWSVRPDDPAGVGRRR